MSRNVYKIVRVDEVDTRCSYEVKKVILINISLTLETPA